VKLINFDNLVLLGPGSEWFWSALSGVVLAVTLLALYRQVRLQRAAGAMEQASRLSREWYGERMTRSKLGVLTALQSGAEPAAVPPGGAGGILNFWEEMGYLAKAGHLEVDLVFDVFGGNVLIWWFFVGPYARAIRLEQRDPEVGENFEWLVSRIRHLQLRAGGPVPTAELARQLIPGLVIRLREELETFEALRAVIVRSGPPLESAT
jgi:hypothetical protein